MVDTKEVAKRVDKLLADRKLAGEVERYFDPECGFAGDTFNTLPDNPPDRITPADLLAVALLGTPFGPAATRKILSEQSEFNAPLACIPKKSAIWEADDSVLADEGHAAKLWTKLKKELDGVGRTRAGKLLARKRPSLIPIVDSVVERYLEAPPSKYWVTIAEILKDEDRRATIEGLRPHGLTDAIPTLRLLDVAIWMKAPGKPRRSRPSR